MLQGLKMVEKDQLLKDPPGGQKDPGIQCGIDAQGNSLIPSASQPGLQQVIQAQAVFDCKDTQREGKSEYQSLQLHAVTPLKRDGWRSVRSLAYLFSFGLVSLHVFLISVLHSYKIAPAGHGISFDIGIVFVQQVVHFSAQRKISIG
jgi:hypothetical protein